MPTAFKEGTSQDVKASAYIEIISDHPTKNGNISPNSYLQLTRQGRPHVLSLLPLQGWHKVKCELHQRETDLQLEIAIVSTHHPSHRLCIIFVNGRWGSGLQRLGVTASWARSGTLPLNSPNSVAAIFNSCPPQRSLVIFSEVLGLRALLKITRPQPNTIRQTIWSSSEKSTRLPNKAEQRGFCGERPRWVKTERERSLQ